MGSSKRRRRLPIGIQSFREIREENFYYVDKTAFALRLVEEGKYYFLSRPRRFGKSLLVDTLKHLFEGHRELFHGLEAGRRWNWTLRYPVVRLDFSGVNAKVAGDLEEDLCEQLRAVEAATGVEPPDATVRGRFRHLIRTLHGLAGQRVVLLVDEYDKPILDALDEPDAARANRDYLRGLYSTFKACDAHVRFCFLTGVSKFSKASLFSGLNNLIDISLEPEYSSICGYAESDLEEVFASELEGLDRDQIREWYHGYSWGGVERVYNPFDVLLLFRKGRFGAWWYETGTPTFLIDMLLRRGVPTSSLDGLVADMSQLSSFDIGEISTEALLFQTGYLTIVDTKDEDGDWFYRLGYPNREVRQSLNRTLLHALVPNRSGRLQAGRNVRGELRTADLGALKLSLQALYAGIPHDWHRRNEIARYEGYYASVFYSFFAGLGLDVRVEDSTSTGRLDMAVLAYGRVYLFEFKVLERAETGAALAQLKQRGYADKYRHLGDPVHLVGVEFSAETRNLAVLEAEDA